jgi:hypothetical protein
MENTSFGCSINVFLLYMLIYRLIFEITFISREMVFVLSLVFAVSYLRHL